MLEESITPLISEVQALLTKSCPSCSATVHGRTMHKQFCEVCKVERKKDTWRKAADVQRRKSGIPKVKGETFPCQACGSDFVATSKSRAKYCVGCRPEATLASARANSFEKGLDQGRKRVGRTETCAHCSGSFVVKSRGNAMYCEACSAMAKANKLPKRRAAIREYMRAWTASNPKHAINDLMRGGILKSITDKGGRSWQDLVDYTVDDLKAHLERQFQPGMGWENRGLNGWHIDHRLPLSSFEFSSSDDPDFKAAWALTNLQPMWGDENIRKKDQILYLL